MKYKNYGDKNNEYSTGLDLELLESTDFDSTRSYNRPIGNLNENQEEIYKLLNTLVKTIYGNKYQKIIPDIYEDFCPDGFLLNSFGTSKDLFLRIPTGAALLTTNRINNSSDKILEGEDGYKDTNKEYNYSRDKFKSYAYVNKPNINLLERQLASIINLDLNDAYNDLRVNTIELPVAYLIYKTSKDGYPITGTNGSFDHLKDTDGRTLYLTTKEKNPIYSVKKEKILKDTRTSDNKEFYKYYYTEENLTLNPYDESHTDENYCFLTYRLEDALYSLDDNGHTKKCIGYSIDVAKTKYTDVEYSSYPNTKKEATAKIDMPKEIENNFVIKISNPEFNGFSFNFGEFDSQQTKIDKIITEINKRRELSAIYNNNDKTILIKFLESFRENYDNCSVTYGEILGTENTAVMTKAIRQEYYRNIFELVNEFAHDSGITLENNVSNFISGETFLKIPSLAGTYHIYYDINCDSNKNGDNPNYDKSGRLFISSTSTSEKNYIKLFEVNISSSEGYKPKITSVKYSLGKLDKRLIGTKRGEFETLTSSLKTELNGDINIVGTTNINTTGNATTNIGNGDFDNKINIGNSNTGKKLINIGNNASDSEVSINSGNNSIIINNEASNKIDITSSTVNITGDVNAFNDMNSNSNLDVNNKATLNNDLTVDGTTTIGGSLGVTGDTTLTGTLKVDKTKPTTLNNDLTVNGITKLNNNLTVDKATTLTGALKVDKTKPTTLNNELTVDGTTTIGGSLGVTGDTTLTGALGVTGNTDISGNLSVTNAKASNTVDSLSAGATTLGTLNKVTGNTGIGGNLTVTGNTTLASLSAGATTLGTLDKVTGGTDITGKLTVTGDAVVGSSASGATEANGTLTVNGLGTFKKGITITGPTSTPDITKDSEAGNNSIANKGYVDLKTSGVGGDLSTHTAEGKNNNSLPHGATPGSSSSNSANKIVARDESGNFYANNITAKLTGNATTASSWETARNLKLTGDATGNVDIKGNENVELEVTVANNSHEHTIDNITNLKTTLGSKITITNGDNILKENGETLTYGLGSSFDISAGHDHPYLSSATKYAGVADGEEAGGKAKAAATANKVDNSLTIKTNSSNAKTFDGSTATEIDITASNVGALGKNENAASASKLNNGSDNIKAGSDSKPVYFTPGGVPSAITSLNLTSDGTTNSGEIKGSKVYGAVWNDLADKIIVPDDTELEFGKCYIFDGKKYRLPEKYAEKGYIGVHSDTYGFSMGEVNNKKQLNSAVAGYVLSYVDKIYSSGTPLTYTKDGILTKANLFVQLFHNERVIGTFWKDEKELTWNGIQVNKRKWIKIR